MIIEKEKKEKKEKKGGRNMPCIVGSAQFEPREIEQRVDVEVKSVKDCLVVYGQVTDCAKHSQPVYGALVKAFKKIEGKLVGLCHTFTDSNGYYLMQLPGVKKGECVVIMASCCSAVNHRNPDGEGESDSSGYHNQCSSQNDSMPSYTQQQCTPQYTRDPSENY